MKLIFICLLLCALLPPHNSLPVPPLPESGIEPRMHP